MVSEIQTPTDKESPGPFPTAAKSGAGLGSDRQRIHQALLTLPLFFLEAGFDADFGLQLLVQGLVAA